MRALLVCSLVVSVACSRESSQVAKATAVGAAQAPTFGESALRPLANELVALADAAVSKAKPPATTFPLTNPTPTIQWTEAPRGKVSWVLFFAELGVLAEKEGGGYARFKFGLSLGPGGLKLAEARSREEAELPKDLPALMAPPAVTATIHEIFAAAKQGKFAALELSSADFARVQSPLVAARLVEDSNRFDVKTEKLAAQAGQLKQVELDDIGLIGVDENGVVFMVGADLDRKEAGFVFDQDESGHLFSAAAVPFMEEKLWQKDLATVCTLAGEVAKSPPTEDGLPAMFYDRLSKLEVTAVTRQMLGAWSRSPKALSKEHAQRLLVEAGGPANWTCPALDTIWGWRAAAAPESSK